LVAGGDFQQSAGSGVAAFAGFTVGHQKRPKAHQTDFVFFGQSLGDSIKNSIHSTRCINFGQAGLISHGGNEFILIHDTPLFGLLMDVERVIRVFSLLALSVKGKQNLTSIHKMPDLRRCGSTATKKQQIKGFCALF
jgi:hypothetical protein